MNFRYFAIVIVLSGCVIAWAADDDKKTEAPKAPDPNANPDIPELQKLLADLAADDLLPVFAQTEAGLATRLKDWPRIIEQD